MNKLRNWQERAVDLFLSNDSQDFLAVATPGAGKTTFALTLAKIMLSNRKVDRITIVCPTEHLKLQWSKAALNFGINLNYKFSNSGDSLGNNYHGVSLTYAQVAFHPNKHASLTENYRTFVIFDEIHHGGEDKRWGDSLNTAFSGAIRRLSLTGTPFRSDDCRIPFISYEKNNDGILESKAHYEYDYRQALTDKVIRPVVFLAYSGSASWVTAGGEEFSAKLTDILSPEQTSRALRTALDPHGDWIPSVFRAAEKRLLKIRDEGIPDAGGLIIASDQQKARDYAEIMQKISQEKVTLVLSDDKLSSKKISEFSQSNSKWMVAVKMVSEGVDIPRLIVGVYATNTVTKLFFSQAVGRFVRLRSNNETANIFIPAIPQLLQQASVLEKQKNHIIGLRSTDNDYFDLETTEKSVEDSKEKKPTFHSLAASAEIDSVIFDGTQTYTNSEEEEDFIGLPGLLAPDQIRLLISQEKRKNNILIENKNIQKTENTSTKTETLASHKKNLSSLVSLFHHKTGKSHAEIYRQIQTHCGGSISQNASEKEILNRIQYIQNLIRDS